MSRTALVSLAGLLAATTVAAAPVPPAAVGRIEASAHGPRAARVEIAQEGSRILVAEGRRSPLSVPPGTRIREVRAEGAALWVAGTRATAGATELWVARVDGSDPGGVDLPAAELGRERDGPVLIGDDDALGGIAWLEGRDHDHLGVRFAPRVGRGFGAAELVAPPGGGSQLALAGTRLSDGRLLLVWAGFDGQDDEIWASLRGAAGWSEPLRVGGDNAVPDILPTVVPAGRGAWISWSRFDVEASEYRVALAAFDGDRFGRPAWVAPPGTLSPTFERDAARIDLLYRDARAGAWVVSELSRDGVARRTSRFSAPATERPAVEPGTDGVLFRLAGREQRAAWQ